MVVFVVFRVELGFLRLAGNPPARWGYSGDVLGLGKNCDAATLKKKENAELNNGRLAMIAIMGFSANALIPGAIPFLN